MPAITKNVDDYLGGLDPSRRKALEQVRKAVASAAPKAQETISYRIPYYKHNGALLAFIAHKNHLSFVTMSYDVVKKFKTELKPFKISGTTIHFQPSKPIPPTLIKKIVKERIKENDLKVKSKSKKKTK
jgi:uncharacterized protein YdhG (YjbR/CyaY superfamily)